MFRRAMPENPAAMVLRIHAPTLSAGASFGEGRIGVLVLHGITFQLLELSVDGGADRFSAVGKAERVESSIAIETAYHKEGLRINDAPDPIERIAWATALSCLVGVGHAFPDEPMPLEVFFSCAYDFK